MSYAMLESELLNKDVELCRLLKKKFRKLPMAVQQSM